jgi:predicted lipoprotein with Yx(FWY)xxD motif
MHLIRLPILAAAAAVVLIAGCGGGSNKSSSSTPATSPSGTALVNSAGSGIGNIVVGPSGRTLYLFKKDTGPTSTCSGACAAQWPPLTTSGALTSSGNVAMSALKTTRRSDGKLQVTLDGHPLYYYSGDTAPGMTNGQGLNFYGATWWALSPSGKEVTVGGSGTQAGY